MASWLTLTSRQEAWHRCAVFHGHVCPGLALGFVASDFAMAKLLASHAEDEELVAVVENDACFADAVQVLTGCTFGKGNFTIETTERLPSHFSVVARTAAFACL